MRAGLSGKEVSDLYDATEWTGKLVDPFYSQSIFSYAASRKVIYTCYNYY